MALSFKSAIAIALLTLGLFPVSMAKAGGDSDHDVAARIDTCVADAIENGPTASYAVAVVKAGQLIVAKGYGFADLEHDVPANAETVYRLGSITKQFTAVAILQLAEQNLLKLDDELTKFLPDYPTQGHRITIHQLLNHTSGIRSITSLPRFREDGPLDVSHDRLPEYFQSEPFDFPPGEDWKYNNSGYQLLGLIIEKVSGQSYAEYLNEHIFQPLAMHATQYDNQRSIIRHRARGYSRDGKKLVNAEYLSMTRPYAAGALVSNILDLVKWNQALDEKLLLSEESYDLMFRPTELSNGKTRPYGYGWQLADQAGHRRRSHGGGIQGFNTVIARYPEQQLSIVVLANTMPAGPAQLEARIARFMLTSPVDEAGE